MITLRCSACKEHKAPDEFHRNHTRKSGRQGQCIACKKLAIDARAVARPPRVYSTKMPSNARTNLGPSHPWVSHAWDAAVARIREHNQKRAA